MDPDKFAYIRLVSGEEVMGEILDASDDNETPFYGRLTFDGEKGYWVRHPVILHRMNAMDGTQVFCTPFLLWTRRHECFLPTRNIIVMQRGIEESVVRNYLIFCQRREKYLSEASEQREWHFPSDGDVGGAPDDIINEFLKNMGKDDDTKH